MPRKTKITPETLSMKLLEIDPNLKEIFTPYVDRHNGFLSVRIQTDYQKILEQQILRLNYKTFTQVVILGSASFVPFMQLPAWQRREVIEDILDIRVFSVMNTILKERINENKDQLQAIENKITIAKNNVEVQKKLIGTLVSSKRDQVAQVRKQIEDNEAEIASNEKRWEELSDQMNQLMADAENAKELDLH